MVERSRCGYPLRGAFGTAIGSATEGADIEYSGRIKSLDPATPTGVVTVAAMTGGRKTFGQATLNVRFR
ncbi:MaoC-like dehydratase [Mycobacterium tuberculosis]|nr:MaoC-like dehydratase [Mycobacterium tuberculosis]SGA94110.1 MaoC-like dehydratase [Mycobacterium tuberculosis]SGC53560.1 MaoC-like dehydratase [Mycobacterium tuberculosis]SGD15887.1 MaoC-like dehydratase [Mycobacterium tuberculosis]SGD16650.1 MaoC-like dehydratase [Mycobacterium tuberculosis]